ncbi:hypothetical protein F2P81_014782 [Scophthalmus maximus]|uniref:Peroxisomal membrane protein PMP34-like n=1 Tax=Scophthalmus maximus TaxID=52904 RepID=A0A6A4SQ84_SCOMX|nr:hypothetical protein F2P81_014782 [Scophthalmus maximus]
MSSEVFSYESLVHAVSGAVGSVTAMTIFFPLDTARLRLQVDENRKAKSTPAILAEIIKEEGLLAPYRGWFPVICSLCCSNFVYFYCFHSLKANWLKGKQSAPSTDLIVGITAGIVNVLITTPLWVVNTRLKLQGSKFRNADIQMTNYSGILDAFVQIVRDEGVGALWNGTFPSLLLVLNPAIQFMIYEGLKRQLRRGVPRELSSVEVFIIGAVAKAVATAVTYPLQTIQSILRHLKARVNISPNTVTASAQTGTHNRYPPCFTRNVNACGPALIITSATDRRSAAAERCAAHPPAVQIVGRLRDAARAAAAAAAGRLS